MLGENTPVRRGIFALLGGIVAYYILDAEYLPIPETLGQLGVAANRHWRSFFHIRSQGWLVRRKGVGFQNKI